MEFKLGQKVRCNGEGDRIYVIHRLTDTSAYLITTNTGDVDAGWESLHQLSLVQEYRTVDDESTVDLDIVQKFATCTVQPGEHNAVDFIVEYAQEILRLRELVDILEDELLDMSEDC